MKICLFIVGLLVLAGCASTKNGSWKDEFSGKNVVNANWGEKKEWNYNFREYGSSADSLWSDPKTRREVLSGENANGKVTSVAVTFDEESLYVHVVGNEPNLTNFYAKASGAPGADIEFYLMPGDADLTRQQTYHWLYYNRHDILKDGQWMMEDRHNRQMAHLVKFTEKPVGTQVVTCFEIPWEAFWDQLPVFSGTKDNFWRMGVCRFGSADGMTFGGEVHTPSRAGYVRWPAFTEEQKTAILSRLLFKAWDGFRTQAGSLGYSLDRVFMDGEYLDKADGGKRKTGVKFRDEQNAADPRSYVNLPEDPGFRPTLKKLIDDRTALAAELKDFPTLAPAARDALYRRAAEMLFNFRYDVEQSYAAHVKEKLMK